MTASIPTEHAIPCISNEYGDKPVGTLNPDHNFAPNGESNTCVECGYTEPAPNVFGGQTATAWQPVFSRWRHRGWFVDNLQYPSGAVGCVSNNYPDRKWRIVCDPRPFEERPTFKTRREAAYAERELIASQVTTDIAAKLQNALRTVVAAARITPEGLRGLGQVREVLQGIASSENGMVTQGAHDLTLADIGEALSAAMDYED